MGFPGLRLFFIKEKPKQKSPDSTQKLSKRQSNYFKTHFSKTKVCLFLGRKMSSSSQPLLNGSTKKHESSPKSQHCRCLMVTLNPLCVMVTQNQSTKPPHLVHVWSGGSKRQAVLLRPLPVPFSAEATV